MLFGRVKNSKKVTLESLGGPFCRNMAPKRGPKRLPKSTKNRPHIDSLWNSLLGGLRDPQKSPKMVPKLSKIIPNRFQVLMFFVGCFVIFSLHVFTFFLKFNALPVHLLRQVLSYGSFFRSRFKLYLMARFLGSKKRAFEVEVKFWPLFGGLLGPSWDNFGRLLEHFGELLGNMLGKSFWHRLLMLFRCI